MDNRLALFKSAEKYMKKFNKELMAVDPNTCGQGFLTAWVRGEKDPVNIKLEELELNDVPEVPDVPPAKAA